MLLELVRFIVVIASVYCNVLVCVVDILTVKLFVIIKLLNVYFTVIERNKRRSS